MAQAQLGALELSPEIELLCASARTDVRAADAAHIQSLLEEQIDWSRLLRLAQQHRVIPLLYRSLTTAGVLGAANSGVVPESISTDLETIYYDNLGRNLFLVDRLKSILVSMAESNIPVVPFKGATTAATLYGDLSLRQFGDLDLLVHHSDVGRAEQCLIAAGYQASESYVNERNFKSGDGKVKIDLHWGFYRDRYCQMNPEAWWDRLQMTTLFDTRMSLFAPHDLLLVLCLNATKAFWDQSLRSICDIAELVKGHPQLDWNSLKIEAQNLRVESMLTAALGLAEDLLGVDLPEEFSRGSDKISQSANVLFAKLRRHLFSLSESPPNHRGGRRWDLLKLDYRRDRVNYLWRWHTDKLVPNAKDRGFLPLPRELSYLYYLVRPVRVVTERCSRPKSL